MNPWSPTSWQSRHAAQQPAYADQAALAHACAQLAQLPPLVTSWEIESLKSQLADAQQGNRFLLQGGDCAESFADCESSKIADKLKILLQMSLVLVHGTRKRVIRVGRFAGQYAKPRSADTETIQNTTLPTYRGDTINRPDFDPRARQPDPTLMLRGYERAALTLNFIRALIDGGFADLHHPEYWDLDFVHHSPQAAEYQKMVESIGHSLRFMETLSGVRVGQLSRVDFFTSHEGLHLLYEQAQTRQVPHREGWYNLSTHFPWLGMRTAALDGAHVEYFRGITNPIAIKIGTDMTPQWLTQLLDVLHPHNEPGRMTLITRFGAHHIAKHLPQLIDAVEKSRKTVLWACDPMHGNTEKVEVRSQTSEVRGQKSEVSGQKSEVKGQKSHPTPFSCDAQRSAAPTQISGQKSRPTTFSRDAQRSTALDPKSIAGASPPSTHLKTRKFEHILAELEQCFEIHKMKGTYLGGVHFELTGENVTECTGGARGLSEADLTRAYRTQVDPRLNYEQALEMAMIIARRVG